jgi:hypothetical protein
MKGTPLGQGPALLANIILGRKGTAGTNVPTHLACLSATEKAGLL